MTLTTRKLRDLLDFQTMMVNESIVTTLSADDEYCHDVIIAIDLDEDSGKIEIQAASPELKVFPYYDALLFCNQFNNEKSFLTVSYNEEIQNLAVSWAMLANDLLDDGILENVHCIIAVIWKFFVAAGKKFPQCQQTEQDSDAEYVFEFRHPKQMN